MDVLTFDPLQLDNRVSLNRTVIDLYGLPAHELLASYAMRETIIREIPALAGAKDPIVIATAILWSTARAATLLRKVTDNASRWLSDAVGVEVTLSHDGTTAARAFAGQPHTAVIIDGHVAWRWLRARGRIEAAAVGGHTSK